MTASGMKDNCLERPGGPEIIRNPMRSVGRDGYNI